MKIVFLNKYQNKVSRGAETFVSELSKRLSKEHGVEVIADISYLDLLRKKYDIIIPTNGRFQVVLVRLISWLKGAKMIVSGQSGIGWDDRINLYSFPDRFIGLTKYQSAWAKNTNRFVKVETIPNGVDTTRFKDDSPRIKNKTKIILAVGAFSKEKRHELTINAVAKLSDAKLIVVGGGGDKKQKIIEHGLRVLGKKRFEFASVPFERMPEYYKSADVLTFPTVPWESFGIVMVEALSCGLPVVVSDDPIRREIVGDAGLFVDPTDTQAYAKALDMALSINWGDKPRRQAEKFSWDIIADKYMTLLKNL